MSLYAKDYGLHKIQKAINEHKVKLNAEELEEYLKLQIMCGVDSSAERKYNEDTIPEIEKFLMNYKGRKNSIIDIGCGEGIALDTFKEAGFKKTYGIELNPIKAVKAMSNGHKVIVNDIHNLYEIAKFDLVYSAHTLEHAWDIDKVLKNMLKLFDKDTLAFIILPIEGDNHLHGSGTAHTYPFPTLGHIKTIFEKHFNILEIEQKRNRGVEAYMILERKRF